MLCCVAVLLCLVYRLLALMEDVRIFLNFFVIMTFSTRACAKWQPAMHQKTIMPGGAAVPMFSRSLRSLIFLGI